jgi:hypothetical protein
MRHKISLTSIPAMACPADIRGSLGDSFNATCAYIVAGRLFATAPSKLAGVNKPFRRSESSLGAQMTHANQQDDGGRDTGEWQ